MKFWVDAQLPALLAQWLSAEYGVEVSSLRDLGMRDAPDIEIFQAAQRVQAVVISKETTRSEPPVTDARSAPTGNPPRGGKGGGRPIGFRVFHLLRVALGAMCVSRHGPPPQLLWVTCGNVTNRQLQLLFSKTFPEALALLTSGQAIVELG